MVRIVCAVLAFSALAALPAGALADSGDGSGAAAASFVARGSAEQAYVTGLRGGERLMLVNRRGRRVQSKRADALGGIVFRNVKPGAGYRVRVPGRRGAESPPFTVISSRPAPPSTRIYDQALPTSGYGYLTTRDGTQLAIDVRLPAGSGPYPTLIEYAGYGYADPAGPDSGIAQIANLLGFAVVDVNMRGTGCSGGAFNYFEPLQNLDAYDVIETVAHQPWVLHHRVGMMGISYGGISQLFVAATDPPDLAAIAPLSVIDSTATTLYPGGLLNTGFALGWAEDRDHDALPASPTGGQPWAYKRIQEGDETCKANQDLHGEAVNQVAKVARQLPLRPVGGRPAGSDHVRAQDQGPGLPRVPVDRRADRRPLRGPRPALHGHRPQMVHVHERRPHRFARSGDLHPVVRLPRAVRRAAAPRLSATERAFAPTVFQAAMGIPGVTLPDDPIQAEADLRRRARGVPARCRRCGSCSTTVPAVPPPGAPVPAFEQSFSRFPLPGTGADPGTWSRRRAGRRPAANGRRRRVHVERARAAPDRLHRRHRRRPVGCGPPRPSTSGSRTRPGRRCRT